MNLLELLRQPESEWLEFKQQYHDNKASFLHDLLCLANAYAEADRYLVFGVTDARELRGVGADTHRRNNANLQDFLRNANLSRIPTCTLAPHQHEGVEIDVLTIKNRPDKPFFVTKDYKDGSECVRNGVIYTRLGETNIPKKESAPDDHIELMWRERFGIGVAPLERAERLLDRPAEWVKVKGDEYLYHRQFPEFTLMDGETIRENFAEPWTEMFPDKSAKSFEVLLCYLSTTLARFTFVACDGERYRIPLPTQQTGERAGKYIIKKSSTAYKISCIYRQYYPIDDGDTLSGVEFVD